jgi:hypothetical protein
MRFQDSLLPVLALVHLTACDNLVAMALVQSANNLASSSTAGPGQQGQVQQQQTPQRQQLQPFQAQPIYPSLPSTLIAPGQALPTMTGVIQQQQQQQQQQRFGPSQPSQPQQLVVENKDPVYGPLQRSTQTLEMMLRAEIEESSVNELTKLVGPSAREWASRRPEERDEVDNS